VCIFLLFYVALHIYRTLFIRRDARLTMQGRMSREEFDHLRDDKDREIQGLRGMVTSEEEKRVQMEKKVADLERALHQTEDVCRVFELPK
jgi:hypothetical protein